MNICTSVQQYCKKRCPKKMSMKHTEPVNTSNQSAVQKTLNTEETMPNLSNQKKSPEPIPTKQNQKRTSASSVKGPANTPNRSSIQEKLNTQEPNLCHQYKNPEQIPIKQKQKATSESSESYEGSIDFDDLLEFRKNRLYFSGMRPRSSSASSVGTTQIQQRKEHPTFGPPQSQKSPMKKSSSFDSKVYDKIAEPKKRSSKLSDPVRNKWANKGAMVYSADTTNHRQSKPAKYWVHTELQYIIMLPMDKPKKTTRKTNFDLTEQPSKEFPEREKENFDDLESSSSDSNESFIPRSQAKPAPKPKGRFCCAKRQASE